MDALLAPRRRRYDDNNNMEGISKKSRSLLAKNFGKDILDENEAMEKLFGGKDVSANNAVEHEPISLEEMGAVTKFQQDNNCQLCLWHFGKPSNPTKYFQMAKVYQYYVDKHGTMDYDEFYAEFQNVWYKHFVKPYEWITDEKTKAKLPKPLSIKRIKAHFEKPHKLHIESEPLIDYLEVRDYANRLKQELGKKDKNTGDIVVDVEKGKHWIQVKKDLKLFREPLLAAAKKNSL